MDAEHIKTERWDILWAAQRSQRYHSRRSAFYSRWNKATAFMGIVGGSAVFASIAQILPAQFGMLGPAVMIFISGVDLVAGTSEMSHKHKELRRHFCELEADIAAKETPSHEDIAAWKTRRLAIEADEPPIYVALNILCDNELARAYPHIKAHPLHTLPWFKRVTAHWLIWENA